MKVALACVLLCPLAAAASTSTVGLILGTEHLSNGTSNWRESTLQFTQAFAPRQLLDLAVTGTERFGLRDTQFAALYSAPLSPALTGTVEAAASSTHRVLARHIFGATLQYEFAPALLVHGGARTTQYNDATVNQGLLMLERYVSAFSWAIAWRPVHAYGATVHGGEVRGSYYYGERNSVGFIAAAGKEAANIAGTVNVSSVRSLALVGRHWVEGNWAVNYTIGSTRQGDFYTRNGIHLGIQHAF